MRKQWKGRLKYLVPKCEVHWTFLEDVSKKRIKEEKTQGRLTRRSTRRFGRNGTILGDAKRSQTLCEVHWTFLDPWSCTWDGSVRT